jgi:phosphoesterase RecJ-like protein
MQDILKIKEVINENKDITIVSHFQPDGDALGSQLALALGLEQMGKKVSMFNKDPIPLSFRFLKNWRNVKLLEELPHISPVLICLDSATWERIGCIKEKIVDSNTIVINIDHHISNTNYGHLNWVEPYAAATCELIYDLLGLLQVKIDKSIATCLYTGISTDTGSFLYENTTATTHIVVSDLINRGADTGLLRKNYYENISLSKMELLKFGLNNLSFTANNQIAWMAFHYDLLSALNATEGDAEGLINHIKNISGVEVAIIFRERPDNKIKISFRSKTFIDVNVLAGKFGGGGHSRASGCIIEGDLQQVIEKVVQEAKAIIA